MSNPSDHLEWSLHLHSKGTLTAQGGQCFNPLPPSVVRPRSTYE